MSSVLILLSTYNGHLYLREQLDSLYNQTGVDFHLLVRDDGSTDNTIDILNEYKEKYHNVTILKGKNIKAIRGFYALINYALEEMPNYDYYAFCDQDDVWEKGKLSSAISAIRSRGNKNSLYFCAATYVDAQLNYIGDKTIKDKGNYRSCIIRNNSLGCTIVTNNTFFIECAKASYSFQTSHTMGYIPYHDVWFYSYACCKQAELIYDSTSHILYRQHSSNVTIAAKGWFERYRLSYKSLKRVANSHEQLARFLLDSNSNFDLEVRSYLHSIATYRENIKNTLRLFFNLDTSLCSKMDSTLWRLLVLMRKF